MQSSSAEFLRFTLWKQLLVQFSRDLLIIGRFFTMLITEIIREEEFA